MASSTTPAAPGTHTPGGTIIPLLSTGTEGASGGTEASGSGGTIPAGRIAGALATTFNVPNGVNLLRFNGKDWANCVKKQPSQDVLHGDTAEEELGLACLVSSYILPHQNSQPGRRGRQIACSKMLSRHARDT